MKWITRERPKIDRIACPWLIKRFIDPAAEFLYVPSTNVLKEAARQNAIPGVELSHNGPECSFDTFLKKYDLRDEALHRLAEIVRAADTDTLENSPEAPGLLAITLGLSANITDDHEMLKIGIVIYDALYAWRRSLAGEKHGWYPEQIAT